MKPDELKEVSDKLEPWVKVYLDVAAGRAILDELEPWEINICNPEKLCIISLLKEILDALRELNH